MENKLKIINPKKGMLKVTLSKLGRFGFSSECNKLFNFEVQKFAKFGIDENKDLYIKISDEKDDESFKLAKCGSQYYISIVKSFEDFNFKKGEVIIFDLITFEDNFYKMQKR